MYIADISCTNATFKHLMYTQEHFYLKRFKKKITLRQITLDTKCTLF